jgi:hypothetical protein
MRGKSANCKAFVTLHTSTTLSQMIVEVTSAQARCHDNATAKYKSDQPTLGL